MAVPGGPVKLEGRIAIVTGGGGSGTGRAIARRLGAEGAKVVVADIDSAGGHETVRLIESARGCALFFCVDVGVATELDALFAFAEKELGGVDLLVNDASAIPSGKGFLDGWTESVRVDLLGTLTAIQCAVPVLARRGGGAIVNVSSTSALPFGRAHVRWPAYDAAKAAVIRLTTALEPLRETHRVRVNCVVPGWIGTPHLRSFYDPLTAEQRKEIGAPDVLLSPDDDIAPAVVRLATDERLAGRVLVLDNGSPPRLVAFGDPGYAALED
jgi:NAD(P)-dependent dehydrogenase (short-subunit alcohol dehydrogenase family)